MAAYVDDRSVDDGDTPPDDAAYGFVRWEGQPSKILGFIAGYGDPRLPEDAHPVDRHAPYLFPGPAEDPTGPEVVEAWDLLVKEGKPGFMTADSDAIRICVQGQLSVFPRVAFYIFGDGPLFVASDSQEEG